MTNIFEKGLSSSMGMFLFIQEKASEVVSDLVDGGRLGAEEGRRFIDDFEQRLKKETKEFRETADSLVEENLKETGVVTKSDLGRIMLKLDKIEDRLSVVEERASQKSESEGEGG